MAESSKKNKQNNKQKGVGVNGNFIPAKKGEPSRNPNGRPKKEVCIPDILRKQLEELDPNDRDGKRTMLQSICRKAILQAIGGDKDARNWVADRTEGKALERVIKQKVNDIVEIK